ncbi:MAG: glutamate racemase [Ignavibacteria bacterium]|nr:glutamate racemase [Ignavibacteria bacterium]
MDSRFAKIGIFDSGVGGLSVLKHFLRYLPHERYVYLGDTARVPYGNKSRETIRNYARQSTNFLLSQKVKLIVVACNTVSSVALDLVEEISNVPIVGMITPTINTALAFSKTKRIGVIGTRATILSHSYQNALKEASSYNSIEIFAKPCPLFVPLVEEGMVSHPSTELIAEEYLAELRQASVDTLILGCTHYPMLSGVISKVLPSTFLVDSGEESAKYSVKLLKERDLLRSVEHNAKLSPDIEFFLTDYPYNFREIAKNFLGFDIEEVKIVNLEH